MAEASYPDDLLYHPEHDWAKIDGDVATFGITWFAQDAMGEVVFFDPPEVGTLVTAGEDYTEVESVKAVSDVIAPLSGEIVEVNMALADETEPINEDPYGDGWMVKVKLSDPAEVDGLLHRDAYVSTPVVSGYTAVTPEDLEVMLGAIGVESIEQLFDGIPAALRLKRDIDLPPGEPEQAVYAELRRLAARNVSAETELCFLGAGMYDHYVPSIVDMLMSRSEFLTPYTPYQPEVSQGGLQVMFEYQTAISELTGLPVSNASLYEGPSAVGAAAYLAKAANKGRTRLLASRGVHPHSRETLATLAVGYGMTVDEIPLTDGLTDLDTLREALGDDVCAVILQQPNFLGTIEELSLLAEAAHDCGALVIVAADPLTLGVIEAPGNQGADVCVGEGQTLGNRLDFGGPSFGFFAATEKHIRNMPGRIAGETTDADGRRGFVLTLQTREQHIRRERATSNICTSQALNALGGIVYLSWLGRQGLVELGELMLQRTNYARDTLAAIDGVTRLHDWPVVREFPLRLDVGGLDGVQRVIERCADAGINPGYALGRSYDEYPDGLLVAITEQRTREDIDRFATVLANAVASERALAASEVAA